MPEVHEQEVGREVSEHSHRDDWLKSFILIVATVMAFLALYGVINHSKRIDVIERQLSVSVTAVAGAK